MKTIFIVFGFILFTGIFIFLMALRKKWRTHFKTVDRFKSKNLQSFEEQEEQRRIKISRYYKAPDRSKKKLPIEIDFSQILF